MLNGTITWNGRNSAEFGVVVERFPSLNRPGRKYDTAEINGRNGSVYDLQKAWTESEQTYQIYAGNHNTGAARDAFYAVMAWLNSADGEAELSDSYDPTHYRRGVFVDSLDIESFWHKHGRALITFRCRPQRYIRTGVLTPTVTGKTGTVRNNTQNIALPLITLKGLSAMPSLLATTGRTETALSGAFQFIPNINTPSLYKGLHVGGASGDATKISSVSTAAGNVTFKTTDTAYGVGLNVPVQPNTSYTISGTNLMLSMVETDRDGRVVKTHTGQAVSYSFHTRPETRYVVFILRASSTSAVTMSSLMLCTGNTVQSYVAYSETPSTLRIGSTMMTIARPFTELTIDCETERVMGGVLDYSKYITMTDLTYGDETSEFLQLDPGDNAFAYTGVASGFSLDPRFWEV